MKSEGTYEKWLEKDKKNCEQLRQKVFVPKACV